MAHPAGELGYEDVNGAERLRHDPANALDHGWQGGSGSRSLVEPDDTLRDAVARGTCKPLCSFRPVRPVD
jgi:hypothetical protein